jgi:hypothetical protein
MSSLNKTSANSPHGNVLSIEDYWSLLESSIKVQQSEGGSYNSIVRNVPQESTPTSGNFTFQISPGGKFDIYDMHNSYLRLLVTRRLTYTRNADPAAVLITFLGDKHEVNFFKQVRIYCSDTLIVEYLDFVLETIHFVKLPQYGDYNSTPIFYLASNLGSNFLVQTVIEDKDDLKEILINQNIFMRITNSFLRSLPITYTGGDYKNDCFTSSLTSSGYIELLDSNLHFIDLLYRLCLSLLIEFY